MKRKRKIRYNVFDFQYGRSLWYWRGKWGYQEGMITKKCKSWKIALRHARQIHVRGGNPTIRRWHEAPRPLQSWFKEFVLTEWEKGRVEVKEMGWKEYEERIMSLYIYVS